MCILQEFSRQYTKDYLLKFIRPLNIVKEPSTEFVAVAVKTPEGSVVNYCQMILGHDGKAKVKLGWKEVVEDFNLQEGNICMFTFTDTREIPIRCRDPGGWLNMEIVVLEADVGPQADIGEPEELCSR